MERTGARPGPLPGPRHRGRIPRVDGSDQRVDLGAEAAVGQRLPVAVSGNRETSGYRQAGLQEGAEGTVLAAEDGRVRGLVVLEPDDLCHATPRLRCRFRALSA